MFKVTSLHSETSSVRAICPRPGGGNVITMAFPGLDTDARGQAWLNPERLDATLTHAVDMGLRLLLVLTQPTELPQGALVMLRQAVTGRSLHCVALPIEDYTAPSAAFLRAWARLSPRFHAVFASGGSVGLCCHHGAGRSGVVAAMHLIEAGIDPAEAVALLRQQFPESVENAHQYDWLASYARAARGVAGRSSFICRPSPPLYARPG